MDLSQKEDHQSSQRPRALSASASGPDSGPILPSSSVEEEIERFAGQQAPLGAFAAQIRSATAQSAKASSAGRLARVLAQRKIELREAIGLAEKSLKLDSDPDLARDLSQWWVGVGDCIRGAALLKLCLVDLPEDEQGEVLLTIAHLYARAGQSHHAVQALRDVMKRGDRDARPYEMHGSFGFWSDLAPVECSLSYLQAAKIRKSAGEEAAAFENLLRAFEVAPTFSEAAQALAISLREKERGGAADEILREYLRRGSDAQRAAHHQRAFLIALADTEYSKSWESALEAELEIDLDPLRLSAVLAEEECSEPDDFESFLVHLARKSSLGDEDSFTIVLLALVDGHIFDWGEEQVSALRDQIATSLPAALELGGRVPRALDSPGDEQKLRELRKELPFVSSQSEGRSLRSEIAVRECARGAWADAFEVFEPLLLDEDLSLYVASLGVLIAGRCRNLLGRAQALVLQGKKLPGAVGAVTLAVSGEMLLSQGHSAEARRATEAAIELSPASERALASQAVVALSAPEGASAGQLERSLSVLVARGEACALLCDSANERESYRLGLTWAGRALALRPGDEKSMRVLLEQAQRTGDIALLEESLSHVMSLPAPATLVVESIAQAIGGLGGLLPEAAEELGSRVLENFGVRFPEIVRSLTELGRACGAPRLLASITERQLVTATRPERAELSLVLCRQRLNSGESSAAIRALRRALAQGAEPTLVDEILKDFSEKIDADGVLALLEIRADLLEKTEPLNLNARARSLRHVGVARFDMAQDLIGAVLLWIKAAEIEPEFGLEHLGRLLHHLAGPEGAIEHLRRIAAQTEAPERSGKLLGLVACELRSLGKKEEAFATCVDALQRAPLLTEFLVVAESCAEASQTPELSDLYDQMLKAVMGSYGERALHYRAACELESRGVLDSALAHACAAFEAVPSDGVTFVLMSRLGSLCASPEVVVGALERAAGAAESDEERTRWLGKAAEAADSESLGGRQRVSILLRAAQLSPDSGTIASLLDAIAHSLTDYPESSGELWGQFKGVAVELLSHATGAHGAEVALELGVAAITHFDEIGFALDCLLTAVREDIEIPEYEKLITFCPQLAQNKEGAAGLVQGVKDRISAGGHLGGSLARLSAEIAEALGDTESQMEILVRGAVDFPEDEELLGLARGVVNGAERFDLLMEIESLMPMVTRMSSVMHRLGDLSPRDGLDALLELDLDVAPHKLHVHLLQAIGERQNELGESFDAALTYRELHELEPDNELGLRGVQAEAARQGDYEEVVRVLQVLLNLAQDDSLRIVHGLEIAKILDDELTRPQDARHMLQGLADEFGSETARERLAESWERSGDFQEAAEIWLLAQKGALEAEVADRAAYRAASCFLRGGVIRKSKSALGLIKSSLPHYNELALEIARKLEDKDAVRDALIRAAEAAGDDGAQASPLYLEAAQLALDSGDQEQGRRWSELARKAAPDNPEVCLLTVHLMMLQACPRNKEESQELMAVLNNTFELESEGAVDLREFARAQCAQFLESESAARAVLHDAIEKWGERSLFLWGLAQLRQEEPEAVLPLLESAIGGELYGLVSQGALLFQAGEMAKSLGDFARARGLLSTIEETAAERSKALEVLQEIASQELNRERDTALQVLTAEKKQAEREAAELQAKKQAEREAAELQAKKQAELRIQKEREIERAARSRRAADQRESLRIAARQEHLHATRAASEHEELAPPAKALSERPSAPALTQTSALPQEELLAAELGGRFSPPKIPDLGAMDELGPRPGASEAANSSRLVDSERAAPRSARGSRIPPKTGRSESQLVANLETGDIASGLELLERLTDDRTRSRDAMVVAQHLAALDPGDASLLGRLVSTASRDGNTALARAVRHVLGAYGAGDPVVAPRMDELEERGSAARALLTQAASSPIHEAIGLVWEHASSLYKKDIASYGISGIERVQRTADTPIGRLYRGASRVLDMSRTAVFRISGQEDIAMQVVLMVPPAVLVAGDLSEESPELSFHFGAMLAAASPEHALLFGCAPEETQHLLDALALSFGSGRAGNGERPHPEVTRIASFFWETIPARAQRRLSQLCSEPDSLDFAAVAQSSRKILRRAGLLVCGDLPTAIADACSESGVTPPSSLAELSARARELPAVADLLGLAISPEYAELRFHERMPSASTRSS